MKQAISAFARVFLVFFLAFGFPCLFMGEHEQYYGICVSGPYGRLLTCGAGNAVLAAAFGLVGFAWVLYERSR